MRIRDLAHDAFGNRLRANSPVSLPENAANSGEAGCVVNQKRYCPPNVNGTSYVARALISEYYFVG